MPRRRLGQHFLSDPRILARIADALPARPGDPVLEIGPGTGSLTRVLVQRGYRVTAIERDVSLTAALAEALPGINITAADALLVDWRASLGRPAGSWYAIGNIPYYITSPLIDKALSPPRPSAIVFLLQKEVALRLAAAPGTKDYGALTVGVSSVARVERLFSVPAGAFRPPPEVASAVVRLTPLGEPLVGDAESALFRRMVTALFGARRKQLLRAVRTALGVSATEAGAVLERAELPGDVRPETLAVEEFVRLFRSSPLSTS